MRHPIRALFLDIGGVLGTNGWDRTLRKEAADKFSLDYAEMDERHHLTFDTYEEGKITLDEYLKRVVFYEKRSFSASEFKTFLFERSKPYPEMIQMFHKLKSRYRLKVAAVSNEGRELTEHRIKKLEIGYLIDFYIVSSFVHIRKPDEDIYRIALDIAQVPRNDVVYIDDRAMFVEVAEAMGIKGIHHTDLKSTKEALSALELYE
jgi:putative hydrolase of the HAD superfamily